MDFEFAADGAEGFVEPGFDVVEGLKRIERHPAVFDGPTQSLDQIQLWAITWQRVDFQTAGRPVRQAVLEQSRGMHRCVVQNDDRRTADVTDKVVEHTHHDFARDRSLHTVRNQFALRIHEAQRLDSAAFRRSNLGCLADRLPALGDGGRQAETDFVEELQVDFLGGLLATQFGEDCFCLRFPLASRAL